MQRWWEEQEARLSRLDSPQSLALTLVQRFAGVGLPASLSLPVAHGLGAVQTLTADLVKVTESLLLAKPDDPALLRAHLAVLDSWVESLRVTAAALKGPLDQLMAALAWEPNPYDRFRRPEEEERRGGPQERAKLDGRYGGMHFLFERLDLQLEGHGLPGPVRQGLARSLAEVFDALLALSRDIYEVSRQAAPRRGAIGDLLLDTGAVLHLKLTGRHLAVGPLTAAPVTPGLKFWLTLAATEGPFS